MSTVDLVLAALALIGLLVLPVWLVWPGICWLYDRIRRGDAE